MANFPAGGVLPEGWVQPAGSNAPWAVATDSVNLGTYSLKSGAIGHSQSSSIAYTAVFEAGNVSFARRVSSEGNYDFLRFFIDDVQQATWSGEVAWSTVVYAITAGMHTIRWTYSKDGSVVAGSDAAWIDSVVLPLGNNLTRTTQHFTQEASAFSNVASLNRTLTGFVADHNGATEGRLVSDVKPVDFTRQAFAQPSALGYFERSPELFVRDFVSFQTASNALELFTRKSTAVQDAAKTTALFARTGSVTTGSVIASSERTTSAFARQFDVAGQRELSLFTRDSTAVRTAANLLELFARTSSVVSGSVVTSSDRTASVLLRQFDVAGLRALSPFARDYVAVQSANRTLELFVRAAGGGVSGSAPAVSNRSFNTFIRTSETLITAELARRVQHFGRDAQGVTGGTGSLDRVLDRFTTSKGAYTPAVATSFRTLEVFS